VRRAGLDYWPDLAWQLHESYENWRTEAESTSAKVFYVETSGDRSLYEVEFKQGDWLVFGKETTGLTEIQMRGPDAVRNSEVIYIPMPGKVRSFNLSNAVAVSVFEVLRQAGRKSESRRKP
jgi:tRNA (cytidine/uridine-2'-O-)-methyltransferase